MLVLVITRVVALHATAERGYAASLNELAMRSPRTHSALLSFTSRSMLFTRASSPRGRAASARAGPWPPARAPTGRRE